MADAPCPELEPLLERFADGESDLDESRQVREHLAARSPCRGELLWILYRRHGTPLSLIIWSRWR